MRIAPAPARGPRPGSPRKKRFETLPFHSTRRSTRAGEDDPDFGPHVPGPALVVAEQGRHFKSGLLEAIHHLRDRHRPEREAELPSRRGLAAALNELLIEARDVI